ncbi:MAG: hypothetical protein MN733_20740, partial [Nitrososphaera sp.]|nr:hypothetical protein [Nitrososphaera sp.]
MSKLMEDHVKLQRSLPPVGARRSAGVEGEVGVRGKPDAIAPLQSDSSAAWTREWRSVLVEACGPPGGDAPGVALVAAGVDA